MDLRTNPLPTTLKGYPVELQPCINLVYTGAGAPPPAYEDAVETPQGPPTSSNASRVLLAFSGGNDSTAVALRLRDEGKEVSLFHVVGVNTSYPNETEVARSLAKTLGMPFIQVEARRHGKTDFFEQPTKDQLIMAMMVDHGEAEGINIFATGNESLNFAKDCNILYNWSDSVEMHEAAAEWFRARMPTYSVVWGTTGRGDSINTIAKHDTKIFEETICCLLPYRYQAVRKRGNEVKYGITLGPNRCGSCYKCCGEYLCRLGMGVADFEDMAFARHCYDLFVSKLDISYTPGFLEGEPPRKILDVLLDSKFTDIDKVLSFIGLN